VTALVVPPRVLAEAGAFFESCGAHGCEGAAMLKDGPAGTALVIPSQKPWRSPTGGVSVEVSRAGQMELARALGPDDRYVARIHSHPAEAFHSRADDANPVLTHEGALSIVVPFFGLGLRLGLDACAVLRLGRGVWRDLPVGLGRQQWIRCADGVQ
jgi:hypothetical protein